MVNLNELSIRSLQTSSRRSRKQKKAAVDSDQTQVLDMIEPTSRTMYSRADLKEMYTEDYSPMNTVRITAEANVVELMRME